MKVTVKDDKNKETSFETKTLTALFNKVPKGTHYKVYMHENNLPDQFVGDYVTGSPSGEPPVEPPTHECPQGQHWDAAQNKCVDNIITPPPSPPPTGDFKSWNSNTDGKWNDGNKRTITTKQPSSYKDDGSIFVAASGSPKLVIDGDGIAHLVGGSGGVDNLSLKLRSRHQSGGDCANRAGGEGFAIDRSKWDAKRETCHNIHDNVGAGSLSQTLKDETWYKLKFTCKDEGSNKIRIIGEIDYGSGFKKECDVVDSKAESYFFDKALNLKESWFWIRINNADHPRIYVCRANYNSVLAMDFKFEPSNNAVGLRDVSLTPL